MTYFSVIDCGPHIKCRIYEREEPETDILKDFLVKLVIDAFPQ